ncbi:hypothetical protein BTO04_04710 [Polaribacter sp. SA4-10]|uniref:pentapeptide repeat-containing protein n=1 Tax=Polaribacter sp. SA4-10 TaxID=754397 RepID=UPI000B3C7A35|nr:pentapeptide repeat-containing protein [Polaribacter sp. SA4-10]ARV06044.1 hypothetical protein BTO04_04710 [Polaribacter sp. SA4-10]
MKHKITLFALSFFFITSITYAQKTIEASDIMKDIRNGKSISYKNATIVGTLDFTYMDEAIEKLPRKKKNNWFNWNSGNTTNEIKKMIAVKISFTNCTFKEDVLAYIPDEDSGYTFTASFKDKVLFKECTFKRKAMFKYSHFEKNSNFKGSKFEDNSTFKYAKFEHNSSFQNTIFKEPATFKYAKFIGNSSFSNSVFEETATFKYAKFNDGVSFKNTKFEEDLIIKYTAVSGEFDITGMLVAYEIDSKYTKINGKNFNKYMLDKK